MRSKSLFEGTDFKLAACDRPLNDKVAEECGFNALSIRVVKVIMIPFCVCVCALTEHA